MSDVDQTADAVYLNGRVHTVDRDRPWAEAFAIRAGRFVAVGTTEEIQRWQGDTTDVVDLRGNLVLPGLIDDHMHPDMAAENYFNVNIDAEADTWDDFVAAVQAYLAERPDADWVFGGNLDYLENDSGPIRMFGKPSNKSILDELIPDRPAYFWEVSGHAALVNTRALERLGITADTPDPPGGEYVRGPDGELTGVLRELAAHVVWEEYLRDRPPVDYLAHQWMKPVFGYLNSLGLTSISDVWARQWFLEAYNLLDREGELTMRIAAYVTDPGDWVSPWMRELAAHTIDHIDDYATERVKMLGVKFILDGAAGGRTARLTEPYEGSEDDLGPWRNDPEDFHRKVIEYDRRGLTIKAHAAGDGAIRHVLDVFADARATNGGSLRHSVAHTAILNPADIDRFTELDVVAEFSPVFWYRMPAVEVIADDLGRERLDWLYPIRSVVDTGARASVGTDWTVTPASPWPAIETMVTRRIPGATEGEPLNGAHAITLEEAIHLYTMGGAYAQYREDEIGSIESGKLADFIVVDRDIFEIPIHEVHRTEVLSTVVGGVDAYVREDVKEIIDLGLIAGQFAASPCCSIVAG